MPPLRSTLLAILTVASTMTRGADADAPPPVPGEMIIRFATPPTPAMLADVEARLGALAWETPRHAPHAKGRPDVPHPLSFYRLARLAPDADVAALCNDVAALPTVTLATTNSRPVPAGFPDDPLYDTQWAHPRLDSETAWAITTGDRSLVVGVVDTGCRVTHEDLRRHVWVNDDPPNGIDDDGNGFVDDTYGWDFARNMNDMVDAFGHGTRVAGILAAEIGNGLGIAGTANVTVLNAKWWHTSGGDFSAAQSTYYAVDNGAHIVNLSLACTGCFMPMTGAAIEYATANDVVVIAASGNEGSSAPSYPAGYPNVIAVAAVDIDDEHPSFSNYGPYIDVAAPSPDIATCLHIADDAYTDDWTGTSASAPFVAGLAALVRIVNPALRAADVQAAIIDHAVDVGAPGHDVFFGHGRIDVGATVQAVKPTCAADLVGDDLVTDEDLMTLLAAWGPCAGCPADLDGNGRVDFADLLELLVAWGPCPSPGACCFPDGTCAPAIALGGLDCTFRGGVYQGDAVPCETATCPLPVACCFWDGSCEAHFEPECRALGGTPQAENTLCADMGCPQPGACCLPDGSCAPAGVVDGSDCVQMGGVYQGAGVACADAACIQPGACCLPDLSCAILAEAECAAAGGEYLGNGVACAAVDCTRGACCFADGSCIEMTPDVCAILDGAFQGYGSTCATADCP